jgi:hypothetical protein
MSRLTAIKHIFRATQYNSRSTGLRRRSRPLGYWHHRFESRSRHGCLSLCFCVCFFVVLSYVGTGLCDGLITRPRESYQVSIRLLNVLCEAAKVLTTTAEPLMMITMTQYNNSVEPTSSVVARPTKFPTLHKRLPLRTIPKQCHPPFIPKTIDTKFILIVSYNVTYVCEWSLYQVPQSFRGLLNLHPSTIHFYPKDRRSMLLRNFRKNLHQYLRGNPDYTTNFSAWEPHISWLSLSLFILPKPKLILVTLIFSSYLNKKHTFITMISRLRGIVVSVLATGPKVVGSNPAKAMDF